MTDATALLEAAGDAVAVTDAEGRIEWASRRLEVVTGLPPEAAAGRPIAELTGVELTEGERRATIAVAGEDIPLAVTARPLEAGRRWVVQLRDLRPWIGPQPARAHGQRDVERALGAVLRGALRTAGDEFEGEERPEVIAQVLAEQGRRLIHGAECLIAIVEPGRPDRFRVAGAAGPWASALVGQDFVLEGSLVARALPRRGALETSQAAQSSALSGVLEGGKLRTSRLLPVVSEQPLPDGRTALGTIGFYSPRATPFTAHQRRLMDDFASLVALSLVRAALRRAVRVTAARLETGVELAVELGRSLDVRDVVGRLLERVLDALDTDRAVLLRVEEGETVTEDARDRLGLPDVIGYRHPVTDQPLMRQAIAGRTPVAGGRYLGGQLPGALRAALGDVRHTLTVPLVLEGEAIAVLVLSRRRDAAYGPDDVATVQLLASIAVLALRNAWLYSAARDASRLRSEFLNMAAHELRTPFTVVAGYLSMLRDGSLGDVPEAWRQPLQVLDGKAGELGTLVEDLLLASRLDSGGLPVHPVRVRVNQAAQAALDRALPRARLLGADLALDPAPGRMTALADPDHLGRILDNLLNNALSYSRGTPWIRVRVRRARGIVRVEVEDRGRGISEEVGGRVFERFFRVEEDGAATPAGTGLGLYISRELAHRQGGRLELEWSRVGEGSRFVLTLPAGGDE